MNLHLGAFSGHADTPAATAPIIRGALEYDKQAFLNSEQSYLTIYFALKKCNL